MTKMNWGVAAACVLALSLELIAVAGWLHGTSSRTSRQPQQVEIVAAPAALPAVTAQPETEAVPSPHRNASADGHYAQLRRKIRWVETRMGSDKLLTPDASSRVLLAKSAAERAGLHEVGLSFKDVYGIINAETSWIPRMGASKDGTPNLGIAQFEPATARGLGLRNPNDPVEAIHVAALHMKEAAEWSSKRISGLKLGTDEHAEKLREGVSIFYNLSTRGRNRWNGKNTEKLPIETRLHIRNARTGAERAAELEAQLPASGFLVAGG